MYRDYEPRKIGARRVCERLGITAMLTLGRQGICSNWS